MTTPKGDVDSEFLRAIGEFLNQLKQQTYTHINIESGQKVLDVGCEPGIDTMALSLLFGTTGKVYFSITVA